ncbi:MAG: GNAT family N-acetyltransferase [Actinomycetota bacterium]|nr:GNAT family N-acetyltransferase [Actinomycetota bacterium]
MAGILRDLSAVDLVRAIEENAAGFLLALGRAAGAELRDDGRVRWTIGNCPIDYHNAVVGAELTPEGADEEIEASLGRMREHGVPGSWHVGPSMRPSDLAGRLVDHGFEHGGDDIGMAAELAVLPEGVATPGGFAVERVRSEEDLAAWVETLGSGFGEGPIEAEWVGEMYRRLGFGDEGPLRHYLGRLGGEPVATATLYLGAGVAGVYFVFTAERSRRLGIGAAITLAPLLEARDLGYQGGVLGSSGMGYPVYRRLGFEERCRIGLYEWREAP